MRLIEQIPTKVDSPTVARQCDATAIESSQFNASLASERIATAITGRVNVSPKRLMEPGPSDQQLIALMELAAAAPDHGQIAPWRFILIPTKRRRGLGEAFVHALLERSPSATLDQIESAHEKALRAPVLMVAVTCAGNQPASSIPDLERLVSLGAAIQNVLLGANGMGYGCGLTSGQAMDSRSLRQLLQLQAHETPVCFVNIGTVTSDRPRKRVRPIGDTLLSELAT